VKVTVPEGVIGAKPMPKPGWTLETTKGLYAKAYPYFHGNLSEGVKEITWSGGSLPDDQFDEFVFVARITDAFRPGQTVYFPIQQDCAKGGYNWAQIPAAGQDAHALKEPAPGVRLVAAAGTSPVVTAGALTIQAPWMRATPGGAKVAGGYVRVTNTGKEPDRLVDASIPLATRGEVHSMSVENGVARMAPVEGGLEIKPGETVELKPGGYHLMFMDMKSGLKEGDMVKGTLDFAKAGRVEVTFQVAGIGAQSAGSAEHVH
jgi:copper(I)-binding protein